MIRLVVALAPEAEPLARSYRMKALEGAFRCYRGDDVALVVSGVGKVAAAAATAYLKARTEEDPPGVWLNVGIAGHRSRPRGDLLLAHTVTDVATGERWYPTRLGGPGIDAIEVRTVDRPETEFESEAAYDMEASGFYPVALRFSTAELVQSIKIVSDNRETGTDGLRAPGIRELVEGRVDELASAAEHFRGLVSERGPLRKERDLERLVEAYRSRWRFSATESRQLRKLLSRWGALAPGAERDPAAFSGAARGSDVLRDLEGRLRHFTREGSV